MSKQNKTKQGWNPNTEHMPHTVHKNHKWVPDLCALLRTTRRKQEKVFRTFVGLRCLSCDSSTVTHKENHDKVDFIKILKPFLQKTLSLK